MAEQRPDGFSSNGNAPDAAIGIVEPADVQTPAPDDEATSPRESADAVTADGQTDEVAESAEPGPAPDDRTAFLADLAQAMQTTADRERTRIDEDIARRRTAHLETISGRRDTQAAEIRGLAADDLKAIDEWARGERQRIDQERQQRATALQADLETSLAEHNSKIDGEIEAVEGAIAGYRTEVDAFFAKMNAETDAVEIARLARLRPEFPDLAAISATQSATTSSAGAGQAPVPVMNAEAAADPATAWSQWNRSTAAADLSDSAVADEVPTPVAAAPLLLQSVPASRPNAGEIGERTEDQ